MHTINNESTFKQTNRIFISSTKKFKRVALLAGLNPLSAIASNIGVPFFAGATLSSIANGDDSFTRHLFYLCFTALFGFLCNRIGFVHLMRLQAEVMDDLARLVFNRLLKRGISYHNNHIGGKIVSEAQDIQTSYMNLSAIIIANGSSFILTFFIGLVVIFVQSIALGLLLSFVIAVLCFWTYRGSLRRSRARSVRHKASKAVVAHFSDTIVNIHTVKASGAEHTEQTKNLSLNKTLRKLRLHDWQMSGAQGSYQIAVLFIAIITMLVGLKYFVDTNNVLALGVFSFSYIFNLLIRLFDLTAMTRQVEEAYLNARPMTLMLAEDVEVQDELKAPPINVSTGLIEFKNVTFMYSDGAGDHIFKNFSLTIQPGEKVGIVGPSGSGKSTLTKLLMRFEDIQDGGIAIDGQDIRTVTQTSLRQALSFVPQEPLLFHRTIQENISYGVLSKPSTAAVMQAARQAQADSFISRLPQQYETIVGERGVKLSGGQRQRIVIARAILRNSPILLLDEATSALDSESEQAVQKSFDALMKNKTSIVIAHRLSTIQKLDRIIVLDNGKIVEEGSHQQLLTHKNGLYAKLWKHQSGGFLQDDASENTH